MPVFLHQPKQNQIPFWMTVLKLNPPFVTKILVKKKDCRSGPVATFSLSVAVGLSISGIRSSGEDHFNLFLFLPLFHLPYGCPFYFCGEAESAASFCNLIIDAKCHIRYIPYIMIWSQVPWNWWGLEYMQEKICLADQQYRHFVHSCFK